MDIPVQINGSSLINKGTANHYREFPIEKGEIYNIKVHTIPVIIKNLEGVLWVTRANDPDDYILQRCQKVSFSEAGAIVIQSLVRGRFSITSE